MPVGLLPMLIQLLMPIAVDAAKKKIAAGQTPPPSPEIMALGMGLSGAAKSKTVWFAILLAVGGFLEQNQALVSQFVGTQNMGLVMTVVSGVMVLLRGITGESLAEKGGATVAQAPQTPSSPNL